MKCKKSLKIIRFSNVIVHIILSFILVTFFAGNVFTKGMNEKSLLSAWDFPYNIQYPDSDMNLLEIKILNKTNEYRKQRFLDALYTEKGLALAARYHSGDMAKKGYFNHRDLNNIEPNFRVAKIHRRFIGVIGENIFKMTKSTDNMEQVAEIIMKSWMKSPGHRGNILKKSFDVLGVGCFEYIEDDRPWIYATQVFGTLMAYLSHDFPKRVLPEQEISIWVETVSSRHKAPQEVLWINIPHKNSSKKFSLSPAMGKMGISKGTMITPSKKGLYQLVFHIPILGKSNSYSICHGPLFVVK